MNIISFYMILVILVMLILILMFMLITSKPKYSREKYSTFECGMDLLNKLRLPFSLHFYFISIIFLIFDVELMLILPFIFCLKFYYSMELMLLIIGLFIVLIIGFVYEWWTGLLIWMI